MSATTDIAPTLEENLNIKWNPSVIKDDITEDAGILQRLLWLSDPDDHTSKPKAKKEYDALLTQVNSHLAATTECGTLINVLSSSELGTKEKLDIIDDVIYCIMGDNEWKGSTHNGAKPATSRSDLADTEPEPEPEPETTEEAQADTPSDNIDDAPSGDDVDGLLGELGRMLRNQRNGGISLSDKAEMKRLINAEVDSHVKRATTKLQAQITAHLDALPPRDVLQVQHKDMTVEIDGLVHKQFKDILNTLSSRKSNGYPIWPYLWGAPGVGKTHMAGQLFDALGIPKERQWFYPMDPTITPGRVIGFKNLLSGDMVEGVLKECYRADGEGGGILFDEVDLGSSVLASFNSLDGDGYEFPDGYVKRHKNFYLIASANTLGTGSMNGFVRNKIDASVVDRYVRIKVEYDHDLERKLAVPDGLDAATRKACDEWVTYVQKVRGYVVKNSQQTIHVTPRASINGATLLAHGLSVEFVLDSCLFTYMDATLRSKIAGEFGIPKGVK